MIKMLKIIPLILLLILFSCHAYGEETGVFTLPQSLTVIEDEAFKNNTSIKGVLRLPESVSSIGAEAFSGCTGLTGVPYIPAGIKEIGARAFYGCTELSGVLTLPAGTKVAEDAFAGCTNLIVKYAGEMPAEYFEYTINNNSVVITGYKGPVGQVNISIPSMIDGLPVTEIADRAFYDRANLYWGDLRGKIRIPNGVTNIGEYAFYGCSGFTGNLVIPDSVISIGSSAFKDCSGFTGSLVIPNSVTSIGSSAFQDCSGFTGSLVIPNSVTRVDDGTFKYCGGFTGDLIIPDSITSIGERAFEYCLGFTGDLVIPDSVTSIGRSAFGHCSGFTGDLVIPDSITSIDSFTFNDCSGFTGDLIILGSVTSIGEYAFYDCSGFTGNLIIPDDVTSIGDFAFCNCSGFTGDLNIPDNVTSIGENAFSGCRGFTGNLVISGSVINISYGAFKNCSGFTGNLKIFDGVTSIGENAFNGCSGFTGDLVIPDSVTWIDKHAFDSCSGFNGDLVISDSVTSIGDCAFENCSGFTGNLVIPDSVTSIGAAAFRYCSGFTGNLVIPDSVTSIDSWTFYGCSGFTGDLIIPGSVTSIGSYAFLRCSGFTSTLTIPEGVRSIGDYAFKDCIFDSVYLPKTVGEIGREPFTNQNGNIVIMGNDVDLGGYYQYYQYPSIYADHVSVLGSINEDSLAYHSIRCNTLSFYSDDEGRLEKYAKKYNIAIEKLSTASDILLQNNQFILTPPYEPVRAQNTYAVQLFLLPHDFEQTTVKVESSNPEVIEVVTPEYVVPEGFTEWPKVSVRAVSEGSAIITATLANGYSDSCEITVGSGTAVAENCVVAGIDGFPATILYDPEEKSYSQTEFKATFGIANVDHTSQYDGLVVELPDGPVEIESIMVQLSANLSFSKGTPDSSITFVYQPESDLPGHVCELETSVVLSLGERWEYSLPVYILEPERDSSLPFKATIVAYGKDGQTYQYVCTISKNYPQDPVTSSIQTVTISEAVENANQADAVSDDETEQIYAEFVNQFKSGKLNASVINELQLQYMTGPNQKKLGDRIISLLNTWVTTLCIDQFAAEIGKVNCFESEMSIALKTGRYPGTYTFRLSGLGASSAGMVDVSVRSETNPYLKNEMVLAGYVYADFEGFSDQMTEYVNKQRDQLLKYVFKGVYKEFYKDLFPGYSFDRVYEALEKAQKWYSWLTNGKNDWEEIKKEVTKDAPNLLLRLAGVEETFESITKGFGFDFIKEFMKSFESTGFNTSIKILNMQ